MNIFHALSNYQLPIINSQLLPINSMHQAKPPLEFIPPAFNPLVLKAFHLLLPQWINWKTAISKIEADNVEILVDLYRQFQTGKTRFLIAFRHPQTEDPLCLSYLFAQIMPKVARQQGIKLKLMK